MDDNVTSLAEEFIEQFDNATVALMDLRQVTFRNEYDKIKTNKT